jgi:pyruvate dehydrogenase E1 component alpha subunit
MTKDYLVAFEKEVARRWEAGEIKAPVHLSGNNEDQLIEIFQNIKRTDWVLSTWRSHYHALRHGLEPDELMRQILAGKSMSVNSVDPPFYSSAIAGGILPIAVGLGMAIKRKGEDRRVFCFVGDMVSQSGIFHETKKYAFMFDLPVTFIIEDNLLSVRTPTREVWGLDSVSSPPFEIGRIFRDRSSIDYRYELSWPHHGSGGYVTAF